MKSTESAIEMIYNNGDLLLFKGTAGPYSAIQWIELEMFWGMSYDEAYALGWRATDEGVNEVFSGLTKTTCFWSTTEYINDNSMAFNRTLSYFFSQVGWFSASHYHGYPKNYRLSVRC